MDWVVVEGIGSPVAGCRVAGSPGGLVAAANQATRQPGNLYLILAVSAFSFGLGDPMSTLPRKRAPSATMIFGALMLPSTVALATSSTRSSAVMSPFTLPSTVTFFACTF